MVFPGRFNGARGGGGVEAHMISPDGSMVARWGVLVPAAGFEPATP